jgi:hypothetical protein
MKCVLLVATGVLAISSICSISSTASAGGYLGLGLGTTPGVNDEMATTATPVGRSLRGLGGIQFGKLSVEGALNGFGVVTNRGDRTVYQASVAAKLNLPLGNHFEGFGRAGLERTWLNLDDDRYDFAGNGFLVGAGFEYRLDLGLHNASIFVDYTIHHASLENTRGQVDETSRIWGLGFTVGI